MIKPTQEKPPKRDNALRGIAVSRTPSRLLPVGFSIRSVGRTGLVLHEGERQLAVVSAPQWKRVRVCICLIHAARYLARRHDLRLQEMEAVKAGNTLEAHRLSDEWIKAQHDFDRAVNLAYGRLGAHRGKRSANG